MRRWRVLEDTFQERKQRGFGKDILQNEDSEGILKRGLAFFDWQGVFGIAATFLFDFGKLLTDCGRKKKNGAPATVSLFSPALVQSVAAVGQSAVGRPAVPRRCLWELDFENGGARTFEKSGLRVAVVLGVPRQQSTKHADVFWLFRIFQRVGRAARHTKTQSEFKAFNQSCSTTGVGQVHRLHPDKKTPWTLIKGGLVCEDAGRRSDKIRRCKVSPAENQRNFATNTPGHHRKRYLGCTPGYHLERF